MSLNANKVKSTGGKVIPLLEPASYPARIVQVLDLGLQIQRPWKPKGGEAEEKKPQYEINVTYEFVDEFLKDEDGNDILDKPRWLSERFPFYSLTADKATSTKRYNAIDPKGESNGDWSALVGAPVMVTVYESNPDKNKKTYNNISNVSGVRDKEAKNMAELVNPPKVFSLDNPDIEIFLSLPEWLQGVIKENLEYEGSALETALANQTKATEEEKADTSVETPEDEANEAKGDW